jgi:Flp pilus assembly pilin Flp
MAREMLTYVSPWHGISCHKRTRVRLKEIDGQSPCDAGPQRKVENGDDKPITAKQTGLKEDTGMDKITGLFVKVREYQKGQTMAEYALIMAAVAVVVFVGYQTMGSTITTLLTTVDTKL